MVENEIEEKLQKQIVEYRTYESRLNSLNNQREMFSTKIIELSSTLNSIKEISRGGADIIFPIGSGSFVKGKLLDEGKILVEIGSNVALNMSLEESREYLKNMMNELENGVKTLDEEMKDVVKRMKSIEAEAQKMIADSQKKESDFRVVSG